MPTCKQCQSVFPNWVKIDKKRRNLSNRQYCLICSPFGEHKIVKPKTKNETLKQFICKSCGKDFWSKYNRAECSTCHVQKHRKKRRIKAIEYKGGKCIFCGYNKCYNSLAFHHVDPNTKEYDLSSQHSISWEKCKAELDKCVLLCANCHGEVHAGIHGSVT